MIFWLILLGISVYFFVVQRSFAPIKQAPLWLLYLVMLSPALVLVALLLVEGNSQDGQLPVGLILSLFVICPIIFIYWYLTQGGRMSGDANHNDKESSAVRSSPADTSSKDNAVVRPIDREEEARLHNCFPWSVYYLQNIEYRPQAMICRGQLRTQPTIAYDTVSENIRSKFGNRFLVVFQEGLNGKPFFALVPNPQAKEKSGSEASSPAALHRPWFALGLLLITLCTTTLVGAFIAGLEEESLQADYTLILQGLPYALSLMAILGTHEMGHYLMARHHHIRTTLPYFIPVPFFLGTFGAFIQLRSPVPNRRALFDVGIAGPMAGLVVTLPLLIWGLANSEVVGLTDEASLLNFQALEPRASTLLLILSKLALGAGLSAESAIQLHPVAVAGCLGLVVTALNLMPVGQLDGGHIVHAMYGQRMGAVIGQVARLLVLMLAFIHREFLLWAILLFFIPAVDEPALNDVSELNNQRDGWGLAALALLVMIVLPAPQMLVEILL
ncbi:MAG: site-2 protease family protein [Cyanobacteria bacterium P01_H01_bin.119]